MNPDEMQNEEQKFFEELTCASMSDDSVGESHRKELRLVVMQTFDLSQRQVLTAPVAAPNRNASQIIGVAASIAACFLGGVSAFFSGGPGSSNDAVTNVSMESDATIDPLFVATLDEVQALRGRVPPAIFFNALAICQEELEARQSDSEANQVRCLYEMLLRSLRADASKG